MSNAIAGCAGIRYMTVNAHWHTWSYDMDLLSWFYMADSSKHLEGNSNPVYSCCWPPDRFGNGKIWWIKAEAGFPWDFMPYDDNLIYLQGTETSASWTDARSYKSFNPPIPFCDRRVVGGLPALPHSTSQSPYTVYADCVATQSLSLGRVRTTATGVWPIDHGADVGLRPTMVIAYQWGAQKATFPTREQFYLVDGLGLVRWETASLDTSTGLYVVQQTSVFNKIVAGGCPTVVFPCGG